MKLIFVCLTYLLRWCPGLFKSLQVALFLFYDWVIVNCNIYAPHLLYYSCSGYLGCFCLLAIVNSLQKQTKKTWDCMYLLKVRFSPDLCPGVGLLEHLVSLFLVFQRTSVLFSIVTVISLHSPNNVGRLPFLHTLSNIYCL